MHLQPGWVALVAPAWVCTVTSAQTAKSGVAQTAMSVQGLQSYVCVCDARAPCLQSKPHVQSSAAFEQQLWKSLSLLVGNHLTGACLACSNAKGHLHFPKNGIMASARASLIASGRHMSLLLDIYLNLFERANWGKHKERCVSFCLAPVLCHWATARRRSLPQPTPRLLTEIIGANGAGSARRRSSGADAEAGGPGPRPARAGLGPVHS